RSACSQFGYNRTRNVQKQLDRSECLVDVLKHPQYQPMPVERQVMIIFAVTNGYLDHVAPERIKSWEQGFLDFMMAQHPDVGQEIRSRKLLPEELAARLRAAIDEYKKIAAR